MKQLQYSPAQLLELLHVLFPETERDLVAIDHLDASRLSLRLRPLQRHLRPGGILAGPTLMELADTAAYLNILAHTGPLYAAATTSLHIDFLRRAGPGEVVADAMILKLGRRLAVVEVRIRGAEEGAELVARARLTYSLPPPAQS